MKQFLALILILGLNSSICQAGDDRGGGNPCAKDFVKLGRAVYNAIKDNNYFKEKIDFQKLNSAINYGQVRVSEKPLFDHNGGSVPALNNGSNIITLSKSGWCESGGYADAGLALHEYLGLVNPKLDGQYQISSALEAQTGLTDANFNTFLRTGTDYVTRIVEFEHLSDLNSEAVTIESRSIESFFNIIGIEESRRYQVRALINCDEDGGKVDLYSIYADYDHTQKPAWFYNKSTRLNTYKLNSSAACMRLKNQAQNINGASIKIEFGMDSLLAW